MVNIDFSSLHVLIVVVITYSGCIQGQIKEFPKEGLHYCNICLSSPLSVLNICVYMLIPNNLKREQN